MTRRRPKQIAPRLADGTSREKVYNAFPPAIKAGLRAIAARENASLNWVMERVMLQTFKKELRAPTYVTSIKSSTVVPIRRRA